MIITPPPAMNVVDRTISRNSLPSLPEGALAPARAGDTVSISSEALQASQAASASAGADQAPDEASLTTSYISSLSETINGLKGFLKPENIQNFLDAAGEEATRKNIENLNSGIASLEKSLIGWSQHIAGKYEIVGSLPTKQEDGTWSQGSFSLYSKEPGSGPSIRSSGKSLGLGSGNPVAKWSSDNNAQMDSDMPSANVALQTLKSMKM